MQTAACCSEQQQSKALTISRIGDGQLAMWGDWRFLYHTWAYHTPIEIILSTSIQIYHVHIFTFFGVYQKKQNWIIPCYEIDLIRFDSYKISFSFLLVALGLNFTVEETVM